MCLFAVVTGFVFDDVTRHHSGDVKAGIFIAELRRPASEEKTMKL